MFWFASCISFAKGYTKPLFIKTFLSNISPRNRHPQWQFHVKLWLLSSCNAMQMKQHKSLTPQQTLLSLNVFSAWHLSESHSGCPNDLYKTTQPQSTFWHLWPLFPKSKDSKLFEFTEEMNGISFFYVVELYVFFGWFVIKFSRKVNSTSFQDSSYWNSVQW